MAGIIRNGRAYVGEKAVNVVAEGNTNSVTSNAVANAINATKNYLLTVNNVANAFVPDSTHCSSASEILGYKEGNVASVKAYVTFKDIASGEFNKIGTVSQALRPMGETLLTVYSTSDVYDVLALARILPNGDVQVWGTSGLNDKGARIGATYFVDSPAAGNIEYTGYDWYQTMSAIDPDWATTIQSMSDLAKKFTEKRSIYINFSVGESRTAASIGLIPANLYGFGGLLHIVTGAWEDNGRGYAVYVPDTQHKQPYFCASSNWTVQPWNWKLGDDQYSTEERTTGKVWIDGRPIYRRVLTFASSITIPNTELTSISSALVETPANIQSWVTGDIVFIQKTGNNSEAIAFSLNKATGVISGMSLTTTNYTIATGYHIMIEYTKTSDPANT